MSDRLRPGAASRLAWPEDGAILARMQPAISALLLGKSVIAAMWFMLIFAAERRWPAAGVRAPTAPLRRVGRNLGLWALNTALSPLGVIPLSAWAAAHALEWRPPWWRGGAGLALDLVLLDLLLYGWHRANHRVSFLWRFHAVHHLDRRLDSTTALRFHLGEVLLSASARAGVIIVLAVPLTSVLVFETVVLLATLFHHSALRLPPRLEQRLARLVVTPSIHWVHHRRRQRDTDANYSTVLSLWDPLFRSRSPTLRVAAMELGVEGRDEATLPVLLFAPFR